MKKYIPYIVIPLITYLVAGFIHMQFNPQYWTQDIRVGMIDFSACLMIIYPIAKYMIKSMNK
jgi:hypothetical protein